MRLRKSVKFIVFSVIVVTAFLIINSVNAETEFVTPVTDGLCRMDVSDNGERGDSRELQLSFNDFAPGKRIDGMSYCLESTNCDNESNWIDVTTYNPNNVVSAYAGRVGTDDLTLWISVPKEKIKLRPEFVDFEPFDISYKAYTVEGNADDYDDFGDKYTDDTYDFNKYEANYHNIVTGYRGGDIILPTACTSNGCMLKLTFSNESYNAYKARFDAAGIDNGTMIDLSSMFNHLSNGYGFDTAKVYYVNNFNFDINVPNELYMESDANSKSFFIVVNKRFFETNRVNFTVGDNFNKIVSTDYLGLDFSVDKKYFDEGANIGFLSFNDFNEYNSSTNIFYGAPEVQFYVDTVRPVVATDSSGMGQLTKVYNTIESGNQDDFPIVNNKLQIGDFYRPEYVVPLKLKNGNTVVANINLTLHRFAFSEFYEVKDSNGNRCNRGTNNTDCTNLTIDYRGLFDTFYSNDSVGTHINAFMISQQQQGLTGEVLDNQHVHARNLNFNPWALAIYYNEDTVVGTQSFNLGELVKVDGFNHTVIPNSQINGHAKDIASHETINDYNSADYTYFGYGLGYEQSIKDIEYFDHRSYLNTNISTPLIIATQDYVVNNGITRIAMFVVNGELKPNEANFPELTYGVGEGKIYDVDYRVFEEYTGGGH